ncbi:uncharacterized protein LOC131322299 [Rhododendron vialii]|uniref:uncharacterized protein LOC131322299 n=1 Tax=Rhododendron vialii TaxID=182163 RepID=UPI00265EBE43|nr:uncharacterized protein LOC131322299 [Rhododendron vialii]
MPQVDLVSSRVAGGDTDELTEDHDQPDLPPESFWLSKDAEYDWFDRNAFYDRNDSTKGNSNTNPNPNPKNLNSGSQRFSNNVFKSRPSVIGLPKTSYVLDATAKRKAASNMNIRLFPPKRSESIAKSTAAEPSSPKVSCMGRVRSKRGRRRRKSGTEAAERPPEIVRRMRTGIFGCCGGVDVFRAIRRSKQAVGIVELQSAESPTRKSRVTEKAGDGRAAAEAPGLGGMTRFASGRRSVSWGVDDVDTGGS